MSATVRCVMPARLSGTRRTVDGMHLPMALHRPLARLICSFAALAVAADGVAQEATERRPARTVVRNIQILSLDPATPLVPLTGHSIIIEDGVITAIKPPSDEDLRAGDMLVDGGGACVLPGFLEVIAGEALPYSDLIRFPPLGVTTVVGDFDAARLIWYARLDREAAIHGPALAPKSPEHRAPSESLARPWERVWPVPQPDDPTRPRVPADATAIAALLREKSVETARRHGLTDRGTIAIGQRGDLVIIAKHPAGEPDAFPATLLEPIEVVIAGKTMRRSALETTRGMVADADAAIAARPPVGADRLRYLVDSSGLRVGELVVTPDGRSGEEWWGPPIRQTTSWSWEPRSATPGGQPEPWSGWTLRLTQRTEHGFTIEMRAERSAARTAVTARMTAPEAGPERHAEIEAIPDRPILDPVSLVLADREALLPLEEGKAIVIEVLEPIPEAGAVKFGVRRVLIRRLASSETPVPRAPGELLFRIEDEPPANGAIAAPGDAGIESLTRGWVVTDPDGTVLRASMLAPEGITEYFRSLPQPSSGSPPESKPRRKPW